MNKGFHRILLLAVRLFCSRNSCIIYFLTGHQRFGSQNGYLDLIWILLLFKLSGILFRYETIIVTDWQRNITAELAERLKQPLLVSFRVMPNHSCWPLTGVTMIFPVWCDTCYLSTLYDDKFKGIYSNSRWQRIMTRMKMFDPRPFM